MKPQLLKANHHFLKASVLAVTSTPMFFGNAFAAVPACDISSGDPGAGAACSKGAKAPADLFANGGVFQVIANVLIGLVGAVAVLMLIFGGLQYVTSNGDSKRVEGAKNTILYAIIGIVVALLSYAIVSFVTGSLTTTPTSATQ